MKSVFCRLATMGTAVISSACVMDEADWDDGDIAAGTCLPNAPRRKFVASNKIICISLLALILSLTACVAETDEWGDDDQDWMENIDDVEQAISNVTLQPGQTATFPTWTFWGWTTVKARNHNETWGWLLLQVWGGASETMFVPPFGINQLSRQWAGFNLQVTNTSSVPLNVEVW
jgi:hypothetical protein